MKRERVRWCIPIFIVAALVAAFVAAPIAATTMVSVDKKQVNAGGAVIVQSNLGKPGDTAKIEYYYDANKNGIDDDGSVWTSIAVVKDGGTNNMIQGMSGAIEYRWVPPDNLTTGQYLIRVTDSDNSTPKVAPVTITNPATPQISFLVDGKEARDHVFRTCFPPDSFRFRQTSSTTARFVIVATRRRGVPRTPVSISRR